MFVALEIISSIHAPFDCGRFYDSSKFNFSAQGKEDFECPTNTGNGNFADPVTCRRFYQVSLKSVKVHLALSLLFKETKEG